MCALTRLVPCRAGVRQVYGGLAEATSISLHPDGMEVAVGCSLGTVQVLGMRDVYPVTSFNTCEAANEGPVLLTAYLKAAAGRRVLATATQQANGTLAVSAWAVDRAAGAPADQVVPIDTLELTGTPGGGSAGGRRWCVCMHAALGVVLAAEVGRGDVIAFALSSSHRFFHLSRLTTGSQILALAVDESSCVGDSGTAVGGGQLLFRFPDGIELAEVDCEQLRPLREPSQEAVLGASSSGGAAAAVTPHVEVTTVNAAAAASGEADIGDEGPQGSLTSMLLEAARASAGGGGMGLPSLASLSVPAEVPHDDDAASEGAAAVEGGAAAPGLQPTAAAAAPLSAAGSDDAAGVAAAVAQAAVDSVIYNGNDVASGPPVAAAANAGLRGVPDPGGEELLSTLLGARPRGLPEGLHMANGSDAAPVGQAAVAGALRLSDVGAVAEAAPGQAAQESALVERLLNGSAGGVGTGAGTSTAATPHAAAAVPKSLDPSRAVSVAAGPPESEAGAGVKADSGGIGRGASVEALEGSVRECYLMCKGIQSTVSRLQHDVGKVHADVAKSTKAQAVVDKAVRRVEAGVEKVPEVVAAAVKGGLESHLKAAVADSLGAAVAEGFRAAFSDALVPAFEGAMQAMFVQVCCLTEICCLLCAPCSVLVGERRSPCTAACGMLDCGG